MGINAYATNHLYIFTTIITQQESLKTDFFSHPEDSSLPTMTPSGASDNLFQASSLPVSETFTSSIS